MLYVHPHAFVIDGVRIGEKGFEVHMNCGWGGSDNKWYVFDQPFDTHFGPMGGTNRWVMLLRPPAADAADAKARENATQARQDAADQRAAKARARQDVARARQDAAEQRAAVATAREDAIRERAAVAAEKEAGKAAPKSARK